MSHASKKKQFEHNYFLQFGSKGNKLNQLWNQISNQNQKSTDLFFEFSILFIDTFSDWYVGVVTEENEIIRPTDIDKAILNTKAHPRNVIYTTLEYLSYEQNRIQILYKNSMKNIQRETFHSRTKKSKTVQNAEKSNFGNQEEIGKLLHSVIEIIQVISILCRSKYNRVVMLENKFIDLLLEFCKLICSLISERKNIFRENDIYAHLLVSNTLSIFESFHNLNDFTHSQTQNFFNLSFDLMLNILNDQNFEKNYQLKNQIFKIMINLLGKEKALKQDPNSSFKAKIILDFLFSITKPLQDEEFQLEMTESRIKEQTELIISSFRMIEKMLITYKSLGFEIIKQNMLANMSDFLCNLGAYSNDVFRVLFSEIDKFFHDLAANYSSVKSLNFFQYYFIETITQTFEKMVQMGNQFEENEVIIINFLSDVINAKHLDLFNLKWDMLFSHEKLYPVSMKFYEQVLRKFQRSEDYQFILNLLEQRKNDYDFTVICMETLITLVTIEPNSSIQNIVENNGISRIFSLIKFINTTEAEINQEQEKMKTKTNSNENQNENTNENTNENQNENLNENNENFEMGKKIEKDELDEEDWIALSFGNKNNINNINNSKNINNENIKEINNEQKYIRMQVQAATLKSLTSNILTMLLESPFAKRRLVTNPQIITIIISLMDGKSENENSFKVAHSHLLKLSEWVDPEKMKGQLKRFFKQLNKEIIQVAKHFKEQEKLRISILSKLLEIYQNCLQNNLKIQNVFVSVNGFNMLFDLFTLEEKVGEQIMQCFVYLFRNSKIFTHFKKDIGFKQFVELFSQENEKKEILWQNLLDILVLTGHFSIGKNSLIVCKKKMIIYLFKISRKMGLTINYVQIFLTLCSQSLHNLSICSEANLAHFLLKYLNTNGESMVKEPRLLEEFFQLVASLVFHSISVQTLRMFLHVLKSKLENEEISNKLFSILIKMVYQERNSPRFFFDFVGIAEKSVRLPFAGKHIPENGYSFACWIRVEIPHQNEFPMKKYKPRIFSVWNRGFDTGMQLYLEVNDQESSHHSSRKQSVDLISLDGTEEKETEIEHNMFNQISLRTVSKKTNENIASVKTELWVGVWYFVAVTHSRRKHRVSFYIDGTLVKKCDLKYPNFDRRTVFEKSAFGYDMQQKLLLGKIQEKNILSFYGQTSTACFYNKELSKEEIRKLFLDGYDNQEFTTRSPQQNKENTSFEEQILLYINVSSVRHKCECNNPFVFKKYGFAKHVSHPYFGNSFLLSESTAMLGGVKIYLPLLMWVRMNAERDGVDEQNSAKFNQTLHMILHLLKKSELLQLQFVRVHGMSILSHIIMNSELPLLSISSVQQIHQLLLEKQISHFRLHLVRDLVLNFDIWMKRGYTISNEIFSILSSAILSRGIEFDSHRMKSHMLDKNPESSHTEETESNDLTEPDGAVVPPESGGISSGEHEWRCIHKHHFRISVVNLAVILLLYLRDSMGNFLLKTRRDQTLFLPKEINNLREHAIKLLRSSLSQSKGDIETHENLLFLLHTCIVASDIPVVEQILSVILMFFQSKYRVVDPVEISNAAVFLLQKYSHAPSVLELVIKILNQMKSRLAKEDNEERTINNFFPFIHRILINTTPTQDTQYELLELMKDTSEGWNTVLFHTVLAIGNRTMDLNFVSILRTIKQDLIKSKKKRKILLNLFRMAAPAFPVLYSQQEQ
ncbi:hypothetical protein M0811_13084 [Anaeramoeba ignava]|uniref:DUF4704 domain-containing protein n=1 Tax=Anaeramoeba ignava TaxID=1746090 RepID=A0A9Q0L746_ANAIG|nr:hypothetical protein M0811_13084 [Anaeramoeba ignava]